MCPVPLQGELLEQKINSNEVFEEYGHIAKRKLVRLLRTTSKYCHDVIICRVPVTHPAN